MTFLDYLASNRHSSFAIIRHDVDRFPKNAKKMAELEYKLDVSSSYYFRYPFTFDKELISAIRDLGHEIGYHYEVLSQARGDLERAIRLFEHALTEFSKTSEIKTIAAHGSPLSKFDNRILWEKYDFRNYGILGEAYLSFRNDALYITDTGRGFSSNSNLRDKMSSRDASIEFHHKIQSTKDLIELIRSDQRDNIYLTIHPERWAYNSIDFVRSFVWDLLSSSCKKVLVPIYTNRKRESNGDR
jgi:hypothetical protein